MELAESIGASAVQPIWDEAHSHPPEPELNIFNLAGARPGSIGGRPLADWNEAYEIVENYFQALRIKNKLLLGQLVIFILKRAIRRAPEELQFSPTELAVQEMDRVVTDWFSEILGLAPASATNSSNEMLFTRGRLALLLADMPRKWQDQFLHPAPWPTEFVSAMRDAYLRAGPDFQRSKMMPRPLDLGPITTLANFSGSRFFKIAVTLVWLLFALILVAFFLKTH